MDMLLIICFITQQMDQLVQGELQEEVEMSLRGLFESMHIPGVSQDRNAY